MTMNEIINGTGEDFPGLINFVQVYLDTLTVPNHVREAIEQVMSFLFFEIGTLYKGKYLLFC